MRGVNNNNRPPAPLGQAPGMMGRGQVNNPQMMQQMLLQQQQFLARQQIIQQEQLQKQRLLRQQQELQQQQNQQGGLTAAIRELQQKTIQQQLRHPPPRSQQQSRLQPHSQSVSQALSRPAQGMQGNPNANFMQNNRPGDRSRDTRQQGLPNQNMNNVNRNAASSAIFTQPGATSDMRFNTSRSSQSSIGQPSLFNVPPPSMGSNNPGGPRLGFSSTANINHQQGFNNTNNTNQGQGFDQFSRGLNPGIPGNNGSNLNTGSFAMAAASAVGQTSPSMHSSSPSLLGNPGLNSGPRMPGMAGSQNTLMRSTSSGSSSLQSQTSSMSTFNDIPNKNRDTYSGNRSSCIRDRNSDRMSKGRGLPEGDRSDRERRRNRSRERDDRTRRDYDRNTTNFRSSSEQISDRRNLERNGDGDSQRGTKSLSRGRDSRDGNRSSSVSSRVSDRNDSRSSSRNRDDSRSRLFDRRKDESRNLGFTIDRQPASQDSRDRPQSRGRDSSREASLSSVSSRFSSRRNGRLRSQEREQRQRTRDKSRDSSASYRGNRMPKRSRSPSESSQKDFGGLSQYRQDLLSSEARSREEELSPNKKRKMEIDDDGDFEVTKENELPEPELEDINYLTRSCPADLYFTKNPETGNMEATERMVELENRFEEEIVKRAEKIRATQKKVEDPPPHPPTSHHHHHHHQCSGNKSSSSCDSSSSEDDDDDDDDDGSCNQIMEEWDKRKKHPYSLHPELWFNMKGQANDGPLCLCSIKSRQSGIRHDIYPGEPSLNHCKDESNNLQRLYHYRITMSPYTNFLTKVPTLINHDLHEYIFEGFSMFSHAPLENIPPCKLLRFNIEYTIHFIPESAPENFTVRSLNLFNRFIFTEILELIDMDWTGPGGGCNRFHFMPRFCRTLPDSGCKEALSINTVLSFLLKSVTPLVEESRVDEIMKCREDEWHAKVDNLRGMIVTNPGMRPSSIRIDQLDRKFTTPVIKTDRFNGSSDEDERDDKKSERKKRDVDSSKSSEEVDSGQPIYPLIIHQGYRPAQLSYAGDPVYRKAWKQYVKFRHLLNSKPKILAADKLKLKEQEEKLREIRMKKTMKREVTIELSSKGFLCTGLRADLCQHALMIPVLMSHLRFHICLNVLEDTLEYKFEDRNLLQLSLTHTSYRTNYGTNPDHTRNSLTNCGMRQVEYGDRRIHYQNTRKRGICILVDIMSRLGKQEETVSEIPHNERLEFLGDAVIEFLTSVHLFYMFPWLEEGGLTTYRMALVQNQHLAVLAKKLKLQEFMLYVHGPDLCHESDLRHAMANCCEALMGALFLDGGIEVVDRIFSKTLFGEENILLHTWNDLPKHVLQQEEPGGDRHWVKSSPILQKLEKFEEAIGVKFTHIRLLAKSFTHRNIGVTPLTLGHNQRLEFLGDTVLQLVASEYLYKHYPEHHEGHLSLLRSSLVNSRTQGLVYDDLGMAEYVIFNESAISDGLEMKTKQRADILESFVGALFVDKDLDFCRTFCDVCFFPRLKDFIMNQDWNDPKSQLQQCCLTLREVGGGEPDIPVYKVIESIGPTNTRKYVVAVYFRGKRLARGTGHSIQQAEMAAATQALKKRSELFPILQHQRRFLERMKQGDVGPFNDEEEIMAQKKSRKSRSSQRGRHGARKKTV